MYLEFFGLKKLPFEITPDTEFINYLPSHHEAYNHIRTGILTKKGFIQIIGEAGVGKTTIYRAALARLRDKITPAIIVNPSTNPRDLLENIGTEFKLNVAGKSRTQTLTKINQFLEEQQKNKYK